MPKQKPGRSEQDVGTPPWLVRLIEQTWGPILLDPAASERNHVGQGRWYSKEQNGLEQDWRVGPGGIVFINPPYERIEPWVKKAQEHSYFWGTTVAVLIPASVGSNWWKEHVHQKAAVYFLSPRITFVGHDQPYPKDVALLVYGAGPPVYRCIRVTAEDSEINVPYDPTAPVN